MQVQQPLAPYQGSPQKEDGYTPIANELLEAILLYSFSSRQKSVIFAICRMTYGYSKKSDALSGWQIAKMTNIDRSHISKTLDELIKLNVIIKLPMGRMSHGVLVNEITINKHYDTWLTVAETATVAKTAPLLIHGVTVAESVSLPLLKQPTHKAIKTTKTNIAKVKTSALSLQAYLDKCKAENIKALPEDCMVFKTAKKLDILDEWLHTCWLKFKEDHLPKRKGQADWIRTFNNCVLGNWYGIWYRDDEGNTNITSKGRLLMNYFDK
jgi:phage replication O-like protein O